MESLELIVTDIENEFKFQSPFKLKHLCIQMPQSNFEKVVKDKKINYSLNFFKKPFLKNILDFPKSNKVTYGF